MDRVQQIMAKCQTLAHNGPIIGLHDNKLTLTKKFACWLKMIAASQPEAITKTLKEVVTDYFNNLGMYELNIPVFLKQMIQDFFNKTSRNRKPAEIYDNMPTFQDFIQNVSESGNDFEKAYSLFHNLMACKLKLEVQANPSIVTKDCAEPDAHWTLVSKEHDLLTFSKHPLYFCRVQPWKNNKYVVNILQIVAREDAEHIVNLVSVLHRKLNKEQMSTFRKIVVKDKKMYFVFVNAKDNDSDIVRVNGYDLVDISPVDHMGYTRVNAVNNKWWSFGLRGKHATVVRSPDPEALIFLSFDAENFHLPNNVIQFVSLVNFAGKNAIVKDVYGPLPVYSFSAPQMEQPDGTHLLILLYQPGYVLNTSLLTTELTEKTKTVFTVVFTVDTVNLPHFKKISFTKIKRNTFMKKLLPAKHKKMRSDYKTGQMSLTDLINTQTMLAKDMKFMGIVSKNFLFMNREDMIAVRHFLRHGLSRSVNNIVFSLYTTLTLPSDNVKCFVSNTSHIYAISTNAKKRTYVIRHNIEQLLNGYRKCANCQHVEENKRRNSVGKRIALFKVCRLCKAKNFHLNWKDYPCHYCSIECMKTHWKTHKEVHKTKALDRKGRTIK